MPTENRSSNTDPRDVFIRLNPLGLGEAELRKDSTGFEDQRTHSDYLLFLAGYRETHSGPQPIPEPIAWMVGTAFWWTKEEAERDAAATGLPIVGLGPMTDAAPAEQQQGDPVAWLAKTLKGSLAGTLGLARYDQRLNPELYEGPFPVFRHADPGQVERLRAELAQCEAMAAMIAEREWAEHVGTGPVSSKVEAAFTQLHNDLHETGEKLAERDALLQRMKTLFRTDDPFDLYDAVCSALSEKS